MEQRTDISFGRKVEYALLFTALLIAGQAGFALSELPYGASAEMGSVIGVGASVEPNSDSRLAQELGAKQNELDAREVQLLEREAALSTLYKEEIAENNRRTLIIIASVTLILVILILLNFYFDHRRSGREREQEAPEFTTRL